VQSPGVDIAESRVVDLEMSGRVVAMGAGVPEPFDEEGCPFGGVNTAKLGDAYPSSDDAPQLAQISWLRLASDDGEEVVVALIASGFAFTSPLGAQLTLRLHAERADFSPVPSWLELRDEAGGLVVWVATAGSVTDLNVPAELQLAQGAVEREHTGECVSSWNAYRLEARLGDVEVSIPGGARAALGPWHVTNGNVLVQTGDSRCNDAYVASASAAAWPHAASIPLTGGIGGPCNPEWFGPQYILDPSLRCEKNSRFPLGYLTLPCEDDAACPAESVCDQGQCRAPCNVDHDCPYPAECLPLGERNVCQCGEGCAARWCPDGDCAASCPDESALGTAYFSREHAACAANTEVCPDGLERFDVVGCGCGCRLAPRSSCVGPLPDASYARASGGCTPSCNPGELPYADLCGCGCVPDEPASLCVSPPEEARDAYVVEPGCELDCPSGTRGFKDACGCVCADAAAARAICLLNAEPGPCLVPSERWYYEPLDDTCTPFTYGGCLGNFNNYPTREACEAACVPWP
jgi:hypothetical protein